MNTARKEMNSILMIGSFGVEHHKGKWKVMGVGDQTGRRFVLREENPGTWRVSGKSLSGCRVRRRFHAVGLSEAVSQAGVVLFGAVCDSGHPGLDTATAFHNAISSGAGSDEHKRHQYQYAGYFCRWCDEKGLTHWHQLRLVHVREYMNMQFRRGLKAKSVGHYLEPVRSTARFMAANWPEHYRDICATFRLPANAGQVGVYRGEDGNPVLSFEQVLDFLDWLKGYRWGEILVPAVMLQGLCGLQLREALRLRWSDVDLGSGTITIQDHPHLGDRVKNPYRVRRIPVPSLVADHLRSVSQRRDRDSVVPYGKGDKAFGKLLKRALRKWNPGCEIAPKDLRNTLQSHAIERSIDEGWNTYLVDRYVGHAPKSIAERHYFGDKKARLVGLFREHVSGKIAKLIGGLGVQKWHEMAREGNVVEFSHLPSAS